MIHSVRFTCLLDTNVIVPLTVRDILLWFAHFDLYTPKWSQHIFSEWEEVMRRKKVSEEEIAKRTNKMQIAFSDALVENYEPLIEGLTLPDEKDKHVLAAAIKTNANLIVTDNLKDFPEDYLKTFSLSAKKPDDFITDIIDLNEAKALEAFRRLVVNRKNPNMDEFQVLDSLRRSGLKDSANYLHSLL